MQIEVENPEECKPLLTVKVYNGGIYAEHNYPCTVCRENVAILDLSTGIMQPCGRCREAGYSVKKSKRRFRR